jgi:hypothetical protein
MKGRRKGGKKEGRKEGRKEGKKEKNFSPFARENSSLRKQYIYVNIWIHTYIFIKNIFIYI